MDKVKFIARFVIALAVLFIAWIPFAGIFENIRNFSANFFFMLLTGEGLVFEPAEYASGAMTNIITFAALVIATPQVSNSKRIKIIAPGIFILFFIEVFTIDIFLLVGGSSGARIENFMHGAGMVFFPIVMWLVIFYRDIFPKEVKQTKKTHVKFMKELRTDTPVSGERAYTCPLCKKEYADISGHLKLGHKNKIRRRKVKEFLKNYPEIKI